MNLLLLRRVLASAALVTLAAACGGAASSIPAVPTGPPTSGEATVLIEDSSFEPDALRVTPGTTVTWKWNDGGTAHNVVFDGFGSDVLTQGTYSHTFTVPGEFAYRCTLHGGMTGIVAVG